jgi:uncharacterized protein (TIGR02588 family)
MARKPQPKRYPLVEWVSAAIGLAITGVMFGFLALEAAQQDGVPPLLNVVPVSLVQAPGQYVVEFEVRNDSATTGAAVQVEGTLKQGGSDVETSTASLSYVPGESSQRGGLVFTRDPRDYRLDLRVTGYERP